MNREIERTNIGPCALLSNIVGAIGVGYGRDGVYITLGENSFRFRSAEDAERFVADITNSIRLAWPERGN